MRRGVDGLFGCSMSSSDFGKLRRVQTFPGKRNHWIVLRRKGSTEDMKDFVKSALDPLDTSAFYEPSNVPFGIVKMDSLAQLEAMLTTLGVTRIARMADKQPVPNIGADPEMYVVSFEVPVDAPMEIPWPIEGCAESAEIATSSVLSALPISSKQQAAEVSEKQAVDRATQDALLALRTAGQAGGGGSAVTTGSTRSYLPVIVAAGAVAAFLFWRGKFRRR